MLMLKGNFKYLTLPVVVTNPIHGLYSFGERVGKIMGSSFVTTLSVLAELKGLHGKIFVVLDQHRFRVRKVAKTKTSTRNLEEF